MKSVDPTTVKRESKISRLFYAMNILDQFDCHYWLIKYVIDKYIEKHPGLYFNRVCDTLCKDALEVLAAYRKRTIKDQQLQAMAQLLLSSATYQYDYFLSLLVAAMYPNPDISHALISEMLAEHLEDHQLQLAASAIERTVAGERDAFKGIVKIWKAMDEELDN